LITNLGVKLILATFNKDYVFMGLKPFWLKTHDWLTKLGNFVTRIWLWTNKGTCHLDMII
jgi:hypothetical protein